MGELCDARRSSRSGSIELVRAARPTISLRAAALLSGGAVVALLALVLPYFTVRTYSDYVAQTFGVHRIAYRIEHDGRVFYYGRPDVAAAARELLAKVDQVAQPGDRLVVGTTDLRKTPYSDAYLYYMLPGLRPSTYYIEMDPGVANRKGSKLAGDIAARRHRHPLVGVERLVRAQRLPQGGIRPRERDPAARLLPYGFLRRRLVRAVPAVRSRWVIGSALGLLCVPVLVDLVVSGKRRLFSYFAADAFYYLEVARNWAHNGTLSFDGQRATNGFHPAWQLLFGGAYRIGQAIGLGDTAMLYVDLLLVPCFPRVRDRAAGPDLAARRTDG